MYIYLLFTTLIYRFTSFYQNFSLGLFRLFIVIVMTILSYDSRTKNDKITLEKDNKILRAAMLKKRYANMIMKSQQVLGEVFDEEETKKKAAL